VREIVIVPAWRRPEFLKACLTRLLRADDGAPEYWICLDRGYDPAVETVADWFVSQEEVAGRVRVGRREHRFHGNSYNVLSGYREALAERATLVHLVEEDVLVGADYFTFHREAHALAPEAFSVSACRNQFFPVGTEPEPDESALYLHGSYQSIGVSLKAARLRAVMPHVSVRYFSQMVAYCARHFPHSALNRGHTEQDGLLNRVREALRLHTAYAAVPRAYHVGFSGYNRAGEMPPGTLDERAAAILAMSAEELNARAHSYPDHTTIPLDVWRAPISRLICWP
jgi:hypothetical protein